MDLQTKNKRQTFSDDNMIPMINIVFLLLIFFMIAGQISNADPFALELPRADIEQSAKKMPITIYLSADGEVVVNESSTRNSELVTTLRNYLAAEGEQPSVAIKADHSVKAADLDFILQAVKQAGIAKINLYTRDVDEQ